MDDEETLGLVFIALMILVTCALFIAEASGDRKRDRIDQADGKTVTVIERRVDSAGHLIEYRVCARLDGKKECYGGEKHLSGADYRELRVGDRFDVKNGQRVEGAGDRS